MAKSTPCQTPGAVYGVAITETMVAVVVEFEKPLSLTKAQREQLETNIHNVMELVLARHYEPTDI